MPHFTPLEKRKWTFIGIGVGILVLLIVVIVPTATILTRNNHSEDNNGNNNNNNNNNNSDTGTSSINQSSTPLPSPTNGGSLNNTNSNNTGDYPIPYYAKSVSKFANLTRVKVLSNLESKKNIYVIGDIHGCPKELQEMADKIGYNKTTDVIILAGDLTTKGPDTPGAIRKAKELGAYCVRGNHDDYVIRFKTYENIYGVDKMGPGKATLPEGNVVDPMKFKNPHAQVARNLTMDEYNYLVSCPMIIDLPFLNARVVHGGVDPKINVVKDNDPWTVFNIRDIKDEVPIRDNEKGKHWTKEYTSVQSNQTISTKIYYGHDASRGLDLGSITFGLDSGCVYGKNLSALNIRTHQLYQIPCPKYSDE